MRPPLLSLTFIIALLTCGYAEERFDDVEKAYLKALYQQEKPILAERLTELEQLRSKASAKKLKKVVKEIERDITALKARLKKQDKTLKELKDVEPLAVRTSKPDVASEATRLVVAPLAKATMHGGARYDSTLKALVGWTSRQAEVSMRVPTEKGVIYTVELNYSTSDKGRLQIALGTEKFLPNLKDTGGMGKRANVSVGKFTADESAANLTISLPIHRSKPFVQIHSLRLVPPQS